MTFPRPNSFHDWITAASLLLNLILAILNVIQFILAQRRRREGVSLKADLHYRFRERDLRTFPAVVERTEPRLGEECVRLSIRYHGPHSVTIVDARFELASWPDTHRFDPPIEPCTLRDGQSRTLLLVPRHFDLRDVTGFTIHTSDHGVLLKRVRRFLRYQYGNIYKRPWLFRILQRLTGIPRWTSVSDMNPKRCPKCRASRDWIGCIERQVDTGHENFVHVSRRFTCGKCSHEWSADSTEPIPVAPGPPEPPAPAEGAEPLR